MIQLTNAHAAVLLGTALEAVHGAIATARDDGRLRKRPAGEPPRSMEVRAQVWDDPERTVEGVQEMASALLDHLIHTGGEPREWSRLLKLGYVYWQDLEDSMRGIRLLARIEFSPLTMGPVLIVSCADAS